MTKEEATRKLADIIFNAAKNGYMPYDTNDEMCAMNIAKKHIYEFYTSLPSNLDEAAEGYSERFQNEKYKLYAFHGFRDGAMWRDSQAQRLSNDVDRAAELSANDAMIKRQFPSVVYNTGLNCFNHSDLIKQFKAGAEWMAEQLKDMKAKKEV